MTMVSVVVPLYDEEANVAPLVAELLPVLEGLGRPFEIVLVDDGSRDGTAAAIAAERRARPGLVRQVALARNTGQTAAIDAGFRHARGELIVMMDGYGPVVGGEYFQPGPAKLLRHRLGSGQVLSGEWLPGRE